MGLIRHELVPGPRFEQGLHIRHLHGTGRIELGLPAVLESPGVTVPIQLPGRATQSGPVLLAPQNRGCAGVDPGIVLEFVIGLDHKDGQGRGLVVRVEHFGVGGVMGVCRIQGDNRRPGVVSERTRDGVIQFDSVDVVGIGILNAQGHRLHQRVIAWVTPALEVVAAHPDDVGEVLVARAEPLAVGTGFG